MAIFKCLLVASVALLAGSEACARKLVPLEASWIRTVRLSLCSLSNFAPLPELHNNEDTGTSD